MLGPLASAQASVAQPCTDAQPAEGVGQLRQSWEKGVRHLRHLRHPLNVEQKCLRRVSDLSQQ